MAVAFSVAIGSTAFTDHTQAAQAQPTQGQEQQQGQGQDAAPTYPLNLPRQSLAAALNTLSEQTDIQVLFPYDIARSHSIKPVKGYYSIEQALQLMLQDTGLYGGLTDNGVIAISKLDVDQNSKGKNMNTTKKSLLAAMVGLFAAGGMGTVQAQEQVGESARAQGVLDEILVTAQKREQSLQDVPLAITAFDAGVLAAKGIDSAADLQFSVPGLTVGGTIFGSAKATLRGVGSANLFPGGDPGVPIHADGHYIQSTAYLLRDFLDIERVEILRGPQGTLYGRNAIGGSINIITKRPTSEFEAKAGVDFGNYNKRLFRGVVSGPLSENIRGRIAFSDENRDGFVENISPIGEQDLENSDYTSVRGSIEIDVTNNIQALISGYHYEDDGNTTVSRFLSEYPTGSLGPFVNYWDENNAGTNITARDPRKISTNAPIDQSDEVSGGSVDLDWDLGSIIIRSLTAYSEDEKSSLIDSDGSDVVNQYENDKTKYETITQEFQILSGPKSHAKWILGAFYYDEKSTLTQPIFFDNFFVVGGPLSVFDIKNDIDSESMGVFGQIEYPITENLELIAGLRYNRDEKSMIGRVFNTDFGLVAPDGGPILSPAGVPTTWKKTSGKLGLNYHYDDDNLFYISYSTGYKAGGFNLLQDVPYNPEEVAAFEVGVKSEWLDRRIQNNVSVFHYDYSDKQELKRDELVLQLLNAGEATVIGIELETIFIVTSGLTINTSVAYMDAEYDVFDSLDEVNNPGLGVQDLSGNKLPRSPEWKLNLGVQYEWLLNNSGHLTARLDTSWVDEQFSNGFNRNQDLIPSFHKTNFQLSWGSADDLWNATLYVQNLEDDDAFSSRFIGSPVYGYPQTGQLLPPRTYGLSITRDFK
ncbi:TonB-dependent receptor domain-containing protein [SAR92 clade bacterium H246]